ncbi:MAG: hypothetical protein NTW01_02640 [Gammaproteobacteria bacterium]|nr:hypothetical protein [Gammaproteobacteria bacterium]
MSTIRFDREALLHFYDDTRTAFFDSLNPKGHVSGITGLIGEELLLGLLCRYLRTCHGLNDVQILPDVPRQHLPDRKKLDGWIASQSCRRLFQVEVKNWSAHSLGGRSVSASAGEEALKRESRTRWNEYFGEDNLLPASARKVLLEFDRPDEQKDFEVQPVLCFWHPIAEKDCASMSTIKRENKALQVFSGSNFLRALQDEFVEIDSPRLEQRLQLLHRLCAPLPH